MGNKHRTWAVIATAGLVVTGVTVVGVTTSSSDPVDPPKVAPTDPDRTYRAFWRGSWWNAPLPQDPPLNPDGARILEYMRTAPESGRGCLALAGAGENEWGHPIYWAEPSDPTYNVGGFIGTRPSEFDAIRIPAGAQPASNNDGSMTIYDLDKGYVTAWTNAAYDAATDTWSAAGATVTYLRSNGLHAETGRSDEPRNIGSHRGNNGATMTVSWDMVDQGAIRHVLKVALGPEVSDRFVFPMVGSDGDYEGNDPAVPPQGLRLRIKPSIDLGELGLHPQALVIAEALQRYGFYIGDSGGVTALKLENTVAEGRGQLWDVHAQDLCGLPFTPDFWDVLAEGYDPTR